MKLLYMISLSCNIFLVWAIFSFSPFFTHLVGVWHTFFGYASFLSFFFLTCLVGMWHTFFGYASFIFKHAEACGIPPLGMHLLLLFA